MSTLTPKTEEEKLKLKARIIEEMKKVKDPKEFKRYKKLWGRL